MKEDKKRSFRLLPGFIVYVLLLAAAVLFTQFLRSSLSNVFLWFALLLPLLDFAYMMLGRAAVQVYVNCSTERTEKNAPVEYEIRVINSSFLPYPAVSVELSEPSENAARCEGRRIELSLVSFGGYIVNKTVKFPFRGSYEIGVGSVYIKDLFRLFEVRCAVSNLVGVSVAPRVLGTVDFPESAVSDAPARSRISFDSSERADASDIRDYMPGDPVRDIHWKLSSKTEEIKLRQFVSNEKKHTYIFCDFARAAAVPENDGDEVYEMLKKAVSSEKKERREKVRIKRREGGTDSEATDPEAEEKKSFFSDMAQTLSEKRRAAKYKKNIKDGMSAENAEMAKMIDSLIKSSSRSAVRKRMKKQEKLQKKASSPAAGAAAEEAALLKQDLDRIVKAVGSSREAVFDRAAAYGGRISAVGADDYDELCADAAAEISLSAALGEIKKGNRCTVMWFDKREEGGVASFDIANSDDFETVKARLAGADCVPCGSFVSALAEFVPESFNVNVKTVTSNIDPASLGELEKIPAAFGGSGSGCVTEVLLFSPNERFENPSMRSAYIAEAALRLMRAGIKTVQLTEAEDAGAPCFIPVSR